MSPWFSFYLHIIHKLSAKEETIDVLEFGIAYARIELFLK